MHEVGAFRPLWNAVEHYRFTGDKTWLAQELPRLKLAAKWTIDRRRTTMRETLSANEIEGIKRGTVSPFGLQPNASCGDGDITGSRYWWWNDAWAYESLRALADVIGDVDPKAAAEYADRDHHVEDRRREEGEQDQDEEEGREAHEDLDHALQRKVDRPRADCILGE